MSRLFVAFEAIESLNTILDFKTLHDVPSHRSGENDFSNLDMKRSNNRLFVHSYKSSF